MSTARELITDTLIDMNVIAEGQSPDAGDASRSLTRLNSMLGLFNVEGLMLHSDQDDFYLLGANVQSPTIGASGTFVATRPAIVEEANAIDITGTILGTGATTGAGNSILTDATQDFTAAGVVGGRDLVYVVSGTGVTAGIYRITTVGTTTLTLSTNPGSSGSVIVYRVIVIPERSPIDVSRDVHWWADRRTRGIAGTPTDLYVDPDFPNTTLNFYPLSAVAVAIELFTKTQLVSLATLDTAFSLPGEYYEMLMYNLELRLAGPFEKTLSALQVQLAAESRAKIKNKNRKIPKLKSDVPRRSRW